MKLKFLIAIVFITNLVCAQNFHDTQGKLEVSSGGQAAFTLPIAMPPSIKDVGPIINLVYSSGQAGGIAGQGWNISSISAISRIATRKDIDGFVDGVDFDDNDKLALDGQRLLIKSGNYWADGSVYETEVQSNTKVELKKTGESIYFIVTAPDGSRSWYGDYGVTNAKDITAFYIVRYEDTNGNFTQFNYEQNNTFVTTIKEILFCANTLTSPTPLNKIVFSYGTLQRKETTYIKGLKVERNQLLNKIEVFTNGLLFKKYQLFHSEDLILGYQQLYKIQESNGSGELANPIEFEYDNTIEGLSIIRKTYSNNLNFESIELAGDFDGDGSLDFTINNGLYKKLFQGNSSSPMIPFQPELYAGDKKLRFIATTMSGNKLNNFNSIVRAEPLADGLKFRVFNYSGSTINESFSKTIQIGTPSQLFGYGYEQSKIYEGDFNGDGISEVIIMSTPTTQPPPGPFDPCWFYGTCGLGNSAINFHYLDLKNDSSTVLGSSGFVQLPETSVGFIASGKTFIQDMNGDGKSDVFIIGDTGTYNVISFKQLNAAPWIEPEMIGLGTLSNYNPSKPILFGDFNGDAKTDIAMPKALNSSEWIVCFSKPTPILGSFFEITTQNIVLYNPIETGANWTDWNDYYAIDFNKDGKSDIVNVFRTYYKPSWTINDHDTGWRVKAFTNNIGKNGVQFVQTCDSGVQYSDSPEIPMAITSNYRYQGLNNELVIVRGHYNIVEYYKFNKDVAKQNLIKKVTQSNGTIVDALEYQAMETNPNINNGDYYNPVEFYSYNNSMSYPFVELKNMTANKLVSKQTNTIMGITRFKDFKYQGLVANLQGLGALGFVKTARSSWYNQSTGKKTWIVTENDPLKRGATIRTYSQLLGNTEAFSFANEANKLSQMQNQYTETNNAGRYAILLNKQTTTDYLTNVITTTETEYTPDYLLPKKTTTKNFLGSSLQGTSINETFFDTDVSGTGSNYYIGRPNKTVSTVLAYNDSKTSTENIFYNNGNISRTEKNANNAPETIVEEFTYFPEGNLQSKTISAIVTNPALAVQPRTTTYTYDDTKRFVATITDVEGLVTINDDFHPLYGLVRKQTNPYGLTTSSAYDNWGKRIKITDFLNKSVNYAYSKTGNTYNTTTESADDGSSSTVISDALGRVVKKGSKDINGNWSYTTTEYDILGRKFRESEPYFANQSPTQWNTTFFDDYGRIIKIVAFTGKESTIGYNGLTATTNDGVMIKTNTKNANGHVVRTTDFPGGSITHSYDASGNLLTSNYDGIVLTMKYDAWGRKIELNDPSAGLYTYGYDAYGQAIVETTPKGKTTMQYDNYGKTILKHVEGNTAAEKTDTKSVYLYNPTTKLLDKIEVTDPFFGNSSYEYLYDNNRRVYFSKENLPFAKFTKTVSYDTFGRVEVETNVGDAAGKISTTAIKNTYKNGVHWQIKDLDTAAVLQEVQAVNARGQLTTAQLGNGISINNLFDAFGYPLQFNHTLNGQTIMNLRTNFEPKQGNLEKRTNSLFNTHETFEYDSNDRLTTISKKSNQILNLGFDNSTENFEATGNPNNWINFSQSKLNVTAFGSYSGVKRKILDYATAGSNINLTANLRKTSGNTPINIVVRELDPSTNEVMNEEILGIVVNGIFEKDYTVTKDCKLYFYLETDIEVPSGGGTDISDEYGNTIVLTRFTVDDFSVIQIEKSTQSYDARGRIANNELGKYEFSQQAPFQNTNIYLNENAAMYYATKPRQDISYNAFKSPLTIADKNGGNITFMYNAMQGRSAQICNDPNAEQQNSLINKFYSTDGSIEIKHNRNTGQVEFVHYIGGDAYSANVILKENDSEKDYFYLHRDHLGSILAITNSSGTVVEKRHFDAWGSLTNFENQSSNQLPVSTSQMFLDRGYTGHEHLLSVGLIHMNGRLYDPMLHRFLQPDNFVQDPYNTQNYNRYGYCLNNPLKYTDPSGEEITLGAAIVIGVAIGLATYTITALLADVPFNFDGIVKTVVTSAFTSAVTFGIGSGTATIGNFYLRAGVQALSHGTFNGAMSGLNDGNFWNGFASGALSSIAASAWSGGSTFETSNNITTETVHKGLSGTIGAANGVGTIAFGTIAGGAGAALTGGNFWQGAVTGLVVSGLNHAVHGTEKKNYTSRQFKMKEGKVYSEKLVYFKDNKQSRLLYDQAVSESLVDGQLSIYGHGTPRYIQFAANSLLESNHLLAADYYLYNDSSMYKNFVDNGGSLMMNLKSCNTGMGDKNISQELTQYRSGLIIHAAASEWKYDGTIKNNAGYNMFVNGVKVGWDLNR
jgi:RHS repeat-associated protein